MLLIIITIIMTNLSLFHQYVRTLTNDCILEPCLLLTMLTLTTITTIMIAINVLIRSVIATELINLSFLYMNLHKRYFQNDVQRYL